jgi:hypothetical protein
VSTTSDQHVIPYATIVPRPPGLWRPIVVALLAIGLLWFAVSSVFQAHSLLMEHKASAAANALAEAEVMQKQAALARKKELYTEWKRLGLPSKSP